MDKINRDGARKHYYKGLELLKPTSEQDLEGAISEFSKAIFLVDDQHDYFAKRGQAYMLLKDYKTAVSNFKRSLKLQHTAELGRKTSNLIDAEGLARLRHQEFADAIFLFSSALDLDPSNLLRAPGACPDRAEQARRGAQGSERVPREGGEAEGKAPHSPPRRTAQQTDEESHHRRCPRQRGAQD